MNKHKDIQKADYGIPKIIWILWLQGFEDAPEIVKLCVESWKKANRKWTIMKLEEEKLREYVDVERVYRVNGENLSKQTISDIVRTELLSKYGGIWVDSSCICQKPLDAWIEDYMESGFFAFSRPAKERPISTGFIASEKKNYLIKKVNRNIKKYFEENEFKNQKTKMGNKIKMAMEGILSKSKITTQVWLSSPVKKILKLYPYFILHYIFERTCRKDSEARRVWDETPKYSADVPLKALRHGLEEAPSEVAKRDIIDTDSPVYHLSWRTKIEDLKENSLANFIIRKNPYVSTK